MAIRWSSLSTAGSRGTCRWQAPELFAMSASHSVVNTRSSDMYAFAGVLYEVCIVVTIIRVINQGSFM